MGFAMYFYRFSDGRSIGGDKQGLWNFLERRELGLHRSTHSSDTTHLTNADGSVLLFEDGYPRDLILSDPSIHGSELSAFIAHAHLSDDECELLYDLCVSTNFLLVHVDAPLLFVIPDGNHRIDQLPQEVRDDADQGEIEIVVAHSWQEMQAALMYA